MSNKSGCSNPKINGSFAQQNRSLGKQQRRLDIQIIRVYSIQKQRALAQIWTMGQQELCDFFTRYQLFPNHNFSLCQLLQSNRLKLIKTQGKTYFGEVERGRREGAGISCTIDGRVYEGPFTKNEKSGYGIEIYPNGNVYVGEFLNGKKHGQGKFYWFSLSSKNPKHDQFVQYFEGCWWGGLPDGPGTHQKLNGDLYTGQFKNGLKHGDGKERYANGDIYNGQFVNGMPDGYGQYGWSDGSLFQGDFRQGLRNGYGVWKAGSDALESYKGHYIMDKKSGYGIYHWQSGWSYRGNFEGDYRTGYGELYDSDGKLIYTGFWENGQQTEKAPIISGKQQQINFRSPQLPRQSAKHQALREENPLLEHKSSKFKLNSQDFPDFASISRTVDIRMKKRPFSHHSNRTNVRADKDVQQRVSLAKSGRLKGSRGLVGTIKSNLFVACRSAVEHGH